MSALTAGCPSGLAPPETPGPTQDPSAFVTDFKGKHALDVVVRGASCAGCMSKIEGAVGRLPGVDVARLNLSTGRLRVEWGGGLDARRILEAVTSLGYGASALGGGDRQGDSRAAERQLLVAMAVAGIAAGGVMLCSDAIWYGQDMTDETRTLLHWVSALISAPASAFAGLPFFKSAVASIRHRRLNMDVPISLAVVLSLGLSLYQVSVGGQQTYFDAPVMLLFLLLIGRFLDARLRRQAYASANALAAMQAGTATRLKPDGAAEAVNAHDIRPGDFLMVAAGERLLVDAEIVEGMSEADLRLVTGEVEPVPAGAGQMLYAGSVNLVAPLKVRASAPADRSLMAEIGRMLEAGEQRKSSYRKIADKAAEIYVPLVHGVAALGFVGWLLLGASLSQAAFVAVTVLIITCPCAMGLAAPLVQVVAAGRLFREGAYLSSGDALERLATVDHVVFDKTGTLTLGEPVLTGDCSREDLQAAAQLARASRHPFSRAIVKAAGPGPLAVNIKELPGKGVVGQVDGRLARLGNADFVGVKGAHRSSIWFAFDGEVPARFDFDDQIRPDARQVISDLRSMGLSVELLSGDGADRVQRAAESAGIETWTANATPQSKAQRLETLQHAGRKVLMIGDGLNDAGALAGAHASLSPGGALDVARLASDCVYSGESLSVIVDILRIARKARDRMRENFAFAMLYNAVTIPVALLGAVTPLIAAAAMAGSSVIVTLNAMRLSRIAPARGARR